MRKKISSFTEYQKLLKSMLYFFDSLCRDNNIEYSVCCGTLLGAIRHKDIIPWDGDIDVAMTWNDFEQFKNAMKGYTGRYFLNYFPNHYLKTERRTDFGAIHATLVDSKCSSHLLSIDIYTIDFLGDDYQKASEAIELYKKYYNDAKYSIAFHKPPLHKYNSVKQNIRNIAINMFYPIGYLISKILKRSFVSSYDTFIKEYLSFDNKSKYYTLVPYYLKVGVMENNLKQFIDAPFGKNHVRVFGNYDEILTKSYGDYMTPPPKDKQIPYPSMEDLMRITVEYDEELELLLNRV